MAAKLLIAVPSDSRGYAQCLKMPSIILSQKLRPPARRSQSFEIRASGNSFGTYFRVITFKESHGGSEGCVIDGCLPGLPLSEADIQVDLDGHDQSRITTPRKETDMCKITSGVLEGLTTGAPIKIEVPSTDQIGHDYPEMYFARTPSLADATYDCKYGASRLIQDARSARETIGKVAAGSVAKKVLKLYFGTEIFAYVSKVHEVVLPEKLVDYDTLTLDQVYSNIVRCPNPEHAEKMIDAVRVRGESAGGVVTCIVRNFPRGIGSLELRKLEVELAKTSASLPAAIGFELGPPFMLDDDFDMDNSGMRTETNISGGIQGGVSNGEIIKMRITFEPASTISRRQNSVSRDEQEMELVGLHNLCVVPHACLMMQAMAELVVVDRLMAQRILD